MENKIEEMAMDVVNHPTHGKLSWENNSGVHQIKKEGKVVFSGNHEEVATKWKAIKNSIEENLEISLDPILEEYAAVGAKEGVVVDKDTNEPIAKYKKSEYSKNYSVSWHPTFLSIHPEVRNSLEAMDLSRTSPESKDAVVGLVGRHHSRLASKGFKDSIPATRNPDNTEVSYFHPDTNEPVATGKVDVDHYSKRLIYKLHPDFVLKHNISPEVQTAHEAKLQASTTHSGAGEVLSKIIEDVSKKKSATGLHTLGNSAVKVYHTELSPEEASSAHENHLKSTNEYGLKDLNISRLSPTHFIGQNKDYMVHSIVHGNQIHQVTTNINEHGSKKTPLSNSF